MALLGHEIVQSRVWVDPTNPSPPNLNYKFTFPITVFDAVRRDMVDENSETLTQVLEQIGYNLRSKQSLIPAKPANYLVTYAGVAGAVGSIQISKEIPWNAEDQSNERIPTEKAIGDLIRKLGIDPTNTDDGYNIRWSDVVGRPTIYDSLGSNDNAIMSQTAITREINSINTKIDDTIGSYGNMLELLKDVVTIHHNDISNPHHVTISQIGAASSEAFDTHVNAENPHNVTPVTIGLGNVNNTSDMDKPISIATQAAIDAINNSITNMTDDVGELNFIVDIQYVTATGELDLVYRNGTIVSIETPIGESIKSVDYDPSTKELVMTNNIGYQHRTSVSDLFIRYIGSEGSTITITIDGNQSTGDQVIKATINPKSIISADIADDAIVGRAIKDQAVGTSKIRDFCITNEKYADQSITSNKIAKYGINANNLADRIIGGSKLFRAADDNRILATIKADADPIWTQVNSAMIANNAIKSNNIDKYAVTHDKIAQDAVGNSNIEDFAVSTAKIANGAVTTEKLLNESVTSNKLATSITLHGTPKLDDTPNHRAKDNEIVDARWVRDFAKNDLVVESVNIADRAVTGRHLFSSNIKNRVLAVRNENQNPEWSLINNGMMDIDAINTSNIINKAVTGDKIDDETIASRHIGKFEVKTKHIDESAITSEKIYSSHEANRVLAALSEDGHPTYSQVTEQMMAPNAVGTMQIIDGSVTLSKIASSNIGQQVLTVGLSGSIPVWSKIMNQMIADRAIDGSKLFTSTDDNVVLGLTAAGYNPTWIKISGDMMLDNTIKSNNIAENVIQSQHLSEKVIKTEHIADNIIQSNHFAIGSVTPGVIETSPIPGRVLAVSGQPYSPPQWSQVTTPMIEDMAVTKEKIFQSENPYRVLATTQAGTPPEYLMITHQFIVDRSIIPDKLVRDFVLHGTPELTIPPAQDSNDFRIANTNWVRNTISTMLREYLNNSDMPEWVPKFDIDYIPEHAIDGSKLFTSPYGPRVLGITAANEEVEFILIEENLIANGAVTTDKIQRGIHLLGSPSVEIRPSAIASDADGTGQLIPDCQWVLDRIAEATITGSGSPSGSVSYAISPGSIETNHLQNRSVTGEKLFTSSTPNRLIGITTANSSPVYLQATSDMIANRAVEGKNLFSSNVAERVLATCAANSDPKWTQITSGMIEDRAIKSNHIADRSVSENHLETGSVSSRALSNDPIIDENRLMDASVSSTKLQSKSVTGDKIADETINNTNIKDNTITGDKLADDIILPENTSVDASDNYEQQVVRNIIISPNRPSGGQSGDIWFTFA